MRIKKAVITAAGQSQRALPLQTLIDRDGQEKSVLGILIEQALAANVEEICVVVWPGDEARYARRRRPPRIRPPALCSRSPSRWAMATPSLRPRLHRRRPLPAPGGRPSLRQPRRPSPARSAWSTLAEAAECCRLRRAGHAREPAAALRRGRPGAAFQAAGPLPHRHGHRKAHAHRSRAAPHGARPSRRLLSLLLRHARAHARGDGTCCAAAGAPSALRRARRTRPARAIPGAGRATAAATTSARATAC